MIKYLSIGMAAALATACSSGGSDSPSVGEGAGAGLDAPASPVDDAPDVELGPDDDVGFPGDDSNSTGNAPASDLALSDEELRATGGVVTPDQANELVAGRWRSTDGATQCLTAYTFSPGGTFDLSSLDQRSSGFYDFFDDDGGTEIDFDFEESNLQSDCFGESDPDLLVDGVSFVQYANFPDRDTLLLSARPNVGGFKMEFERQ